MKRESSSIPLVINTYSEATSSNSWTKFFHKVSFLFSPFYTMTSSLITSIFSLMTITKEPFSSTIIPVLAMPFVFANNHVVYSQTAALDSGVDILTQTNIVGTLNPPLNKLKGSVFFYIKDAGMWLSSGLFGITYGVGFYLLLADFPMFIRIISGFYSGLFAHRADLAVSRLWSLRRQVLGEPGYENTVGPFLDFTDSLLPLPFVPKSIRKKIAIDKAAIESYANYRAIIVILSAQYLLKNIGGLSTMTSFLVAWSLPFGGPEHVYISGYVTKIMKYVLNHQSNHDSKHEEEEKSSYWFSRPMFIINELNTVITSLFTGRVSAALWGLLIDPNIIYKFGKIVAPALTGPAVTFQLNEQIPKLVNLLMISYGKQTDFDYKISKSIFYPMLVILSLGLVYIGFVQVKAGDSRLLDGEKIGFPEEIFDEYDMDFNEPTNPPLAEMKYCEQVSSRAMGLCHVFTQKLMSIAGFFGYQQPAEIKDEIEISKYSYLP